MRWLRRVLDAGIDQRVPSREAKQVALANAIAVVMLPLLLAFVPVLVWVDRMPAALALAVCCTGACAHAAVPTLNGFGRHEAARIVQVALGFLIPVTLGALVGEEGQAHVILLVFLPVGAYYWPRGRGVALLLTGGALLVGVACLLVLYRFTAAPYPPPRDAARVSALVSLGIAAGLGVWLAALGHRRIGDAEAAVEREQRRTEDLLHNVLPRSVAERLKDGATIADRFDTATVLFADIVDFTPRAEKMPPHALLAALDDVFTRFDQLCDRHGLEKIKTIGDAYMVVGGVPEPRADHADAVAEMALAMQAELGRSLLNDTDGPGPRLRIGIHSGPLVAGVIGKRKFAYDLWGDTVNLASRMESHGVAGRIQVSQQVYEQLRDRFLFEPRGSIPVKGKGDVTTYFLVAARKEELTSG